MLTKRDVADYKALFRAMLWRHHNDREAAHEHALREFRTRLITAHPVGWWTEETRTAVLAKLDEIERSVKR
jgi:hypothetical protein